MEDSLGMARAGKQYWESQFLSRVLLKFPQDWDLAKGPSFERIDYLGYVNSVFIFDIQ